MSAISTTATTPFTPPWYKDPAKAVTFHLRAGSRLERAEIEAELAGVHRAGQVYGFDLRDAARAGVNTLLEGDPELPRVLDALDAEWDATIAVAEQVAELGRALTAEELAEHEMDAETKEMLAAVRKILTEHYGPYRDLAAQAERRRQIAPLIALTRFCSNITGPKITFKRGFDKRVSDATLRQIDDLDLLAAGNRAYAMLYTEPDAAGNSPPRWSSDSAPAISSSGEGTARGGRSRARSGKKTPA